MFWHKEQRYVYSPGPHRKKFRSLTVKPLTIWTDGKAEVGRVREEKRRSEKRRSQKKEDASSKGRLV